MDRLKLQDFCEAAKELGCEVAAIKAVATVESGGRSGFDEKNRLLIRFEGHQFRKHTGGQFDRSHPHLSYSYQNRHGKKHRYEVFNEALSLNKHAALMATSYGLFQPMGFNFEEMGFETVDQMVGSFQTGEKAQLDAFIKLIKNWGLDDELRRATLRDFQGFAKRYNGADYRVNHYDEKMLDYYLIFSKQNLKCPERVIVDFTQISEDDIELEIPQIDSTQSADAVFSANSTNSVSDHDQETEQNPVVTSPINPLPTSTLEPNLVKNINDVEQILDPEPYNKIGFWASIKRDLAGIFGANVGFEVVSDYAQRAAGLPFSEGLWTKIGWLIVFISACWLLYRFVHYLVDSWKANQRLEHQIDANTDVSRKNIKFVKKL